VNEHTGTPINATLVTAVVAGAIALLVDLDILADMVSICALFVFLLVSMAALWMRYQTPGAPITFSRVGKMCALVGSSVALPFNYTYRGHHGVSYAALLVLVLATISFFEPVAYRADTFRIPLQPVLPAVAVFLNCFLVSTLSWKAFVGFGCLFTLSCVWYVVYSVQRSPESEQVANYDVSGSGKGADDVTEKEVALDTPAALELTPARAHHALDINQ